MIEETNRRGFYSKTRYRIYEILKYIDANMKVPTGKEVAEWYDLSHESGCELLAKARSSLMTEEEFESLFDKVVNRIHGLLDSDDMQARDLIKLLQFFKPIKKDVALEVNRPPIIHRLIIEKPDFILGQLENGEQLENIGETQIE